MKQAGGLPYSQVEAGRATAGHSRAFIQPSTGSTTGRSFEFKLALAGALLALLAFPAFQDLWMVWSSRADASHGFLIPLIAAVLFRQRWHELRRLPPVASPGLGIPLILLSLAGLLLGNAGAVVSLSGLSLIGLLTGLVVTLAGADWWRRLAFPLGYLLFMVPVLDTVTEPLQQPFQLLTATMARLMLGQLSIPVFQSGTMLHLPTGTVQVAAECSGVGFLISILAIGLPLAVMGLRTGLMRTALIATTLILSVGANWVRVALIAWSGHLWGWGADLHGPLHLLHAMSVYWIGLSLLLCGLWVGRKLERRLSENTSDPQPPPPSSLPLIDSPAWTRTWAATCVLMSVALVPLYSPRAHGAPSMPALSELPATIGEWVRDGSLRDTPPVIIDQADREWIGTYRNASGDHLQVYVAYLASQSQGRELINHRTGPLHRQATVQEIPTGRTAVTVQRTTWEGPREQQDLVFWYQVQGHLFTGRLGAKLMTAVASLTGAGSQGALVVISRPLALPQSGPTREDALVRFTQEALPALEPYLQ